jgi:CO/xanthine dehydrogenase Mo-binding subunit
MTPLPAIDRREFLKGGASLVFTLGAAGTMTIMPLLPARAQSPWGASRPLAPTSLDTWLSFDTDGAVTAYFGKMDMGQGVDTAIAQVVAEELDVDVARVSVVMGDTHRTANQGGASGSSGCRQGANPLRSAAAEARRVFLARAGEYLGAPVEALRVADGTVFVTGDPSRAVSYAELIAQGFATDLDWNGQYGNGLAVTGTARPKRPSDYAVVGTSVPRKDIPGKIFATTEFCHHVTLPGMLHGRTLRPPVANAVPVAVDERSIAGIPGARAVWKQDFLAVVAASEWHAIKAARQLVVTWSETEPPFPSMDALFTHIRNARAAADSSVAGFGGGRAYDPLPSLDAIAASATVLEAEYEVPFQSHARMAPSVGLADVKDGEALVFSDTQKPHNTRDGIAKMLGLPPEKVRVIWKPGPGSYGRSDADEAAFEAAVLSQEVGAPVRVQWMRDEGHAWDPKAPACVISCKAGLDARGDMTGWYFRAKGFSGWDVMFNAADPRDTLVGQLLGFVKGDAHNFGVPGESYAFPNAVKFWETIPPLLARASPLRCAHMRAPQEPQLHFAQECFIDEVAAAAGVDPIALRLRHLTDTREIAVLEAVASLSHWQSRASPATATSGAVLRGRGVAINSGFGGYVATVCEVEVDRASGRVWPRRFFVAHDCGLIINPQGLRATIEGNVVQGVSRALFEEVRFDARRVQSVDWISYPILEIMDAPESIEIATLNRPEVPAGGAGEPAHVTIPAAIGNAVFDATGVRFRRLPLTAERVKAARVTQVKGGALPLITAAGGWRHSGPLRSFSITDRPGLGCYN